MIGRLDLFVGKHLLVPVVVMICQRAGISQYRFYRYGWTTATLYVVSFGPVALGWACFVVSVIVAVGRIFSCALSPDGFREPVAGLRRALLIVALVVFAGDAVRRDWDPLNLLFWLAVLHAEYALTIHTIPPREAKEPKRKLRGARTGA